MRRKRKTWLVLIRRTCASPLPLISPYSTEKSLCDAAVLANPEVVRLLAMLEESDDSEEDSSSEDQSD